MSEPSAPTLWVAWRRPRRSGSLGLWEKAPGVAPSPSKTAVLQALMDLELQAGPQPYEFVVMPEDQAPAASPRLGRRGRAG